MKSLLQFIAVVVLVHTCFGEYKRVCYVESWAQYRDGKLRFTPENIDPQLCTHLIYAFATMDSTATHVKADDPADDPSMYKRFNDLKKKNPNLKTMLSIGGWGMGSELFHKAVHSDTTRNTIAVNIIQFIRSRNFDGVDIDWEFPAKRGSPADDKHKFTLFLKVLRHEINKEALTTGKAALIISAALSPDESNFRVSYDIPELTSYLDFVNLMLYDLHGEWDEHLAAAHHAPLFPSETDPINNIDYLAKAWANKGVPKSKIIIGVPFYGRSFNLVDTKNTSVGSKATGGADTYKYFEICQLIKNGAKVGRLVDAKVPFLLHGANKWTGYDDEKSLAEKMKYIIKHGYGGAMVWALDLDDFNGDCGGKTFPLLNAMKTTLEGHLIG